MATLEELIKSGDFGGAAAQSSFFRDAGAASSLSPVDFDRQGSIADPAKRAAFALISARGSLDEANQKEALRRRVIEAEIQNKQLEPQLKLMQILSSTSRNTRGGIPADLADSVGTENFPNTLRSALSSGRLDPRSISGVMSAHKGIQPESSNVESIPIELTEAIGTDAFNDALNNAVRNRHITKPSTVSGLMNRDFQLKKGKADAEKPSKLPPASATKDLERLAGNLFVEEMRKTKNESSALAAVNNRLLKQYGFKARSIRPGIFSTSVALEPLGEEVAPVAEQPTRNFNFGR